MRRSADAGVLLEHGHVMPGPRELARGHETGRTGPDDYDITQTVSSHVRSFLV